MDVEPSIIMVLIVLGCMLGVYFIPSFVASDRKHHNRLAIYVLNLFLGWTFLGWVLALIWACTMVIPQQQPLVSEILPPRK
jgi:Na+/proline symporter